MTPQAGDFKKLAIVILAVRPSGCCSLGAQAKAKAVAATTHATLLDLRYPLEVVENREHILSLSIHFTH